MHVCALARHTGREIVQGTDKAIRMWKLQLHAPILGFWREKTSQGGSNKQARCPPLRAVSGDIGSGLVRCNSVRACIRNRYVCIRVCRHPYVGIHALDCCRSRELLYVTRSHDGIASAVSKCLMTCEYVSLRVRKAHALIPVQCANSSRQHSWFEFTGHTHTHTQ